MATKTSGPKGQTTSSKPSANSGFQGYKGSSKSSSSSSVFGTPDTAHDALVQIGLELAAVAVTAVIAGTGPKAGKAMVALWVLLWLVVLMTRY